MVNIPDASRFDAGKFPLEQRMVELFRAEKGGVLSGEELASAFRVSRTAVWKHVKNLKAKGYRIESVPSKGYRFLSSPDILSDIEIAAGLSSKRIGRRIVCVRETESTNQFAFRTAEEGAGDGTVVLAESQTGGKGRLGRRWESPPGVNLYCSVILRPPILPVNAPQLTFLSAVAVARAIESVTHLQPRIKWPNDILVHERKVAGLLNEMSAETDTVHWVVLGIGVNINMVREQFPDDLRYPASSLLLEEGSPVSRVEFTRSLLSILDSLYDDFLYRGFESVREEWLARAMIQGQRVAVSAGDADMEGTVVGIDMDGALLLRRCDGSSQRVLSGDVRFV
jgi:BirA family biotin operon repressor/biotin-[acetyl-CoA-carboxylase] ligase